MTTRRAFGLLTATLLLGVGIGVVAAPAGAAAVSPTTVAIYGDSVMYESLKAVSAGFARKPGWTVNITAEAGAAPCDLIPDLESDLPTLHPSIVVLETMGASVFPCMTDSQGHQLTLGSQGYYAKYKADFGIFFGLSVKAHASVIFLSPLAVRGAKFATVLTTLNTIATKVAAKFHGVSISYLPHNALAASGEFTMTLACLQGETVAMGCNATSKRIIVRAPDHEHLCPAAYPTSESFYAGCPVYSSGAVRDAKAIVNTIINPPPPVLR